MPEITFNELPQAVSRLDNRLENIERLFQHFLSNNNQPIPDDWFDLNELVAYDPEKRTKPTFYGYIHSKTIPFHKRGKKITFLKSEIDIWLRQGRKRTYAETSIEADRYLTDKKR